MKLEHTLVLNRMNLIYESTCLWSCNNNTVPCLLWQNAVWQHLTILLMSPIFPFPDTDTLESTNNKMFSLLSCVGVTSIHTYVSNTGYWSPIKAMWQVI